MSQPESFNILIVGPRKCGKTSLINRLMQIPFNQTYTLTQTYTQTYNIDLELNNFQLRITELSQAPFKETTASYLKNIDYVILVHDLSRAETLEQLKPFMNQIEKYADSDYGTRCFFIGNKADLAEQSADINQLGPYSLISAKQQNLDPKAECLRIWNTALLLSSLTQPKSIFQKDPSIPMKLSKEKLFAVSIPTKLSIIEDKDIPINKIIKLIVLGSKNVGKSNLIQLFAGQPFEQQAETIGVDFRLIRIKRDNILYKLQMWDTSGDIKYRCIVRTYFRTSNIALFAYDITNYESFASIKEYYEEVIQHSTQFPDHFIAVLIANKAELESQRKVSYEQGKKLAQELNMKFYQVSAKHNHGIMQAFVATVEQLMTQKFIV